MKSKRHSTIAAAPPELKQAFRDLGNNTAGAALAAQTIAANITQVLRKGSLYGSITEGIFQRFVLEPGTNPEYFLDLIGPGVAQQHVAFTIAATGYIPQRVVEGDYISLQTYEVGNAIDWPIKFAQDARFDVMPRIMELYQAGFVKKDNNDAFHTLLAAAKSRGICVYDQNAGAGRLTIRLLNLLDDAMRRNSSANYTSVERGRLTDLFTSPEVLKDMRNWSLAEVPDSVRTDIWRTSNGIIPSLFDIELHPLDEFGYGNEYQNYYLDSVYGLNGKLAPGDVELVLGLDLSKNDSFVNPVRRELTSEVDDTRRRSRMLGYFGSKEHTWGVLDNRRVILGSL